MAFVFKNDNSDIYDILSIYIADPVLKNQYITYIEKHNRLVTSNFPNAGFDLLTPYSISYSKSDYKVLLDTEIICSMKSYDNKNLSYYLYARSSIIKTNLRLANSVGIIDSGYRGNIKAWFDIIENEDISVSSFGLTQYSRLVQICSPTLKPLLVNIIDNLDDLEITIRGTDGFGSTGV
jgi:dUTP pyrophosphatase